MSSSEPDKRHPYLAVLGWPHTCLVRVERGGQDRLGVELKVSGLWLTETVLYTVSTGVLGAGGHV